MLHGRQVLLSVKHGRQRGLGARGIARELREAGAAALGISDDELTFNATGG